MQLRFLSAQRHRYSSGFVAAVDAGTRANPLHVAPMAGLRSRRFSNRHLVAFLAAFVIASYHATPAGASNDGQPPVQYEKDDKGNERVVIGKGWDDGYGYSNEGEESVELLFDGRKYELHLSKRTETHLKRENQLERVKAVLTSEPRLWWINGRFHWQWGWSNDAKLILVGTEGNVYYTFFLPQQTKECLVPRGVVSVAHYDLFALLAVFVDAIHQRSSMPANVEIQTWEGQEEEGMELLDRSPPREEVTKGDATTWLVGRAWQDFTKMRIVDQTKATEVSDERQETETSDIDEETDAYGFRDSQVTVHLSLGEKVGLHIVLPRDIRDTLKDAGLLNQVLEGLESPLPSPEALSAEFTLLTRISGEARTALIATDKWSDMRLLLTEADDVIQQELG